MGSFQRIFLQQWRRTSYARPSNSSSQFTHDIQTTPANRTPSIRVTALKRIVSFLPVRCPLLLFAQVCAVCLRVRVYFVVGGNPCLLLLSSHCSQWLASGQTCFIFEGGVFWARSCWALPFLALCLSDRVLTFPSKHFLV